MAKEKRGTANEPAGGADPGGTHPTKSKSEQAPAAQPKRKIETGDRNKMRGKTPKT